MPSVVVRLPEYVYEAAKIAGSVEPRVETAGAMIARAWDEYMIRHGEEVARKLEEFGVEIKEAPDGRD